jgi:hypothetical protein
MVGFWVDMAGFLEGKVYVSLQWGTEVGRLTERGTWLWKGDAGERRAGEIMKEDMG